MRRIAHISDLHFGREDPLVVEGLLRDLERERPHVVAVSGDLTQRARRSQFAAARAFLDRLPAPYIVVPGNHDVPLYDVMRRTLRPLARYKRYITRDLAPTHVDEEVALVGVNTARSAVLKGGRISFLQLAQVAKALRPVPEGVLRIVVTHHPFIPPPDRPKLAILGRAGVALGALEKTGVDLLLSGHMHLGYTGDVRSHHPKVKRSMLVAQAGTAVSVRRRGEPNGYNLITVEGDRLRFAVRAWREGEFQAATHATYRRLGEGWVTQKGGQTVEVPQA